MLTSGLVAGLPCAAAAAQRPRRALQGAQARPRCAPSRGARLACSASGEGIDPMQGWGGRDVRPGEVESNFGDKVPPPGRDSARLRPNLRGSQRSRCRRGGVSSRSGPPWAQRAACYLEIALYRLPGPLRGRSRAA